jgi:hypothetical protein
MILGVLLRDVRLKAPSGLTSAYGLSCAVTDWAVGYPRAGLAARDGGMGASFVARDGVTGCGFCGARGGPRAVGMVAF